jgi:hypothetical protein
MLETLPADLEPSPPDLMIYRGSLFGTCVHICYSPRPVAQASSTELRKFAHAMGGVETLTVGMISHLNGSTTAFSFESETVAADFVL